MLFLFLTFHLVADLVLYTFELLQIHSENYSQILLFLLIYKFQDRGEFFGVEEKVWDHKTIPGDLLTYCKNIKCATLSL